MCPKIRCDVFGKNFWGAKRVPLVTKKFFPKTSHRIFGHMHGALNIEKLIAQLGRKSRDESFESN